MNYPDEAAAFSAAFLRWKTFTWTPAHYEKNVAKTLVLADISTTKRASITMKRKGGCNMKCIQQDDALIFAFCGDLDNLSILKIKADVIREIDRVQAPVVKFDFKDVTFIDSSKLPGRADFKEHLTRYPPAVRFVGDLSDHAGGKGER